SFLSMTLPPPVLPLFPYTTLFRSEGWGFGVAPGSLSRGLWFGAGWAVGRWGAARWGWGGRVNWRAGSISRAGAVWQHNPTHRRGDRKSTRLNSSHSQISYAVFCLK